MNENPPGSKRAEILPTHTPALFASAIEMVRGCLERGEVVVVPTETVYGLAANAWNEEAVRRVFSVKGRPAGNPVIVHVADGDMAAACVSEWPEAARRLAEKCWPGPLTMVLKRSARIPDAVTAGGPTVGIRWPSHPFVLALIRACGFPLAAPSANRSNAISPTLAEHAFDGLGDRVDWIVDGGPSHVGIESTVVDLTVDPVEVLRPGMISEESIRGWLGQERSGGQGGNRVVDPESASRSPGQLPRHYSPRARIWAGTWTDDADLRKQLLEAGVEASTAHVLTYHRIPDPGVAGRVCVIPDDPEAYARALYAEWHCCDALGAKTIVMEALPATPGWKALVDRITRASAIAEGLQPPNEPGSPTLPLLKST